MHMCRRPALSFGLAWGLVLCASACASTSAGKPIRPSSAFTANDAALFEDGVDMIGDPQSLSGRWADDWSSELNDRIARSDLIALLTVNTVRTDVNPQERTTHWLLGEIDDVLKGSAGGRELSLATSEDSRGFSSVDRERGNLMHQPLLVLAKWVQDPSGEVRARWHLALASPQVVDAVRSQLHNGASWTPAASTR
jgi:hypothetical protein